MRVATHVPKQKSLRKMAQVVITFDPETKDLWIRGKPRNRELARWLISQAEKRTRDWSVSYFLQQKLVKT